MNYILGLGLNVSFIHDVDSSLLCLVINGPNCPAKIEVNVYPHPDSNEYNVGLELVNLIYDMNSILGVPNFESWQHDWETQKKARQAYRLEKQRGKDFVYLLGGKDKLEKLTQIIVEMGY